MEEKKNTKTIKKGPAPISEPSQNPLDRRVPSCAVAYIEGRLKRIHSDFKKVGAFKRLNATYLMVNPELAKLAKDDVELTSAIKDMGLPIVFTSV